MFSFALGRVTLLLGGGSSRGSSIVQFVQLLDLLELLLCEVRAFENLTNTFDHNVNEICFAPPLFAVRGKGAGLGELRELIATVFALGGGIGICGVLLLVGLGIHLVGLSRASQELLNVRVIHCIRMH
jgi:hypothetical protein